MISPRHGFGVPIVAGLVVILNLYALQAVAHGVPNSDAAFLETETGAQFWPYL